MAEMQIAFLSAGSNLGDREENLKNGIIGLRRAGIVVRRISSVYATEPLDFLDQPWFLNIAVDVATRLPPEDLLACCQEIESRHGRVRHFRGAARTLDLDILLFGDLMIDEPSLHIPHPRMTQRRFVLVPLAQIAPDFVHPREKRTILSLLASCTDQSTVTLQSELEG